MLSKHFFDLFENNLVEGVVHAGGAQEADVAGEAFEFVFGDHQAATLDLREEIFFADEALDRVVDFEFFEDRNKVVVFFQNFNHLGSADGVVQKFRLAQHVGKAEVKSSGVIRQRGKTYILRGAGKQRNAFINFFFGAFDGKFKL